MERSLFNHLEELRRLPGFVVLHGTDTMAYSAAALSFMLNNLTKPVIFTGSQLPIGKIRTDGKENLIAAIEIAAAYDQEKAIVPEVASCSEINYSVETGRQK
ncbi:MAG: asparaginase domain-containing protein [Butyricimonas faecihominis]